MLEDDLFFFPEMAVAYSNSQRWLDDLFAADVP